MASHISDPWKIYFIAVFRPFPGVNLGTFFTAILISLTDPDQNFVISPGHSNV